MADEIASIYIDANLDLRKVDQQLAALQNRKYKISVETDQSELYSLNRHLDLKRKDLQKTIDFYKSNPLKVYTNQSELVNLNKQLKEFQDVKIAFKFDDREILKGLSNITKEFQATRLKLNLDIGYLSSQIQKSFEQTIKSSSFQTQLVLKDNRNNREVVNALKSVENAVNKSKPGVLSSITTGIFETLGGNIARQVGKGVRDVFGTEAGQQARKATRTASRFVKSNFIDNEEFQQAAKEVDEILGTRLRKTGYKLGDGIIAGLELQNATVKERINTIIKGATDGVDFSNVSKELIAEFTTAKKKITESIFTESSLRNLTEPIGSAISTYREIALKERAIPLVRERALQILQTTKGKSDQLATKAVTDETENLFIGIGGYAGARGLSGKTLVSGFGRNAPGLNELSKNNPKNAVIFVRNEDTDIPRESLSNAAAKLQALLTSLGKPNLRGYSKDSIEIAAQALAAREKNPNVTINILGESGGGFAAEEANKILKLLGIDSKFIGVGTPDFIGGFGSSKNKIISPDESLGAETAFRYARLGLARRTPQQNILGVKGHPYENYRNAEVAELQNFLFGSPGQITPEILGDFQKGRDFFKSQDKSKLDTKQTAQLAEAAYKNLQYIRRFLLEASDEIKNELEEIVKDFEQVFIDLQPDDRELSEIKKAIAKAKEYLGYLEKQPGVEASIVANRIAKELETAKKQIEDTLKVSVGTNQQQYQQALTYLKQTQQSLLNPEIGIKKALPKIESNFQKQTPGLTQDFIDSSVQQAKNLAQTFRNNYTGDKQLTGVTTLINQGLQSGDLSKAIEYAQNIRTAAIAAKQEITNLRKSLGDEELTAKTSQGKGAYESINSYIGQLSKVNNQIINQFKKIGVELPDIADQIVQGFVVEFSNNKDIEKATEEKFENVIETAKDVLDIQSPSRVFRYIGEQVVKGFEQGIESFKSFNIESFFSNFAENVKDLLLNFTKLGTGFFIFSQALPRIREFATESIKISTNFETIERNIKFLSGANGLKNIAAIKDQSLALGLNVQQSLQGASQLYGATVGTNLEGLQTTEIFKNFQTLFASRSVDPEKQQRANLAISQAASKGIQSEEIRQQLAEAIPGAFQILARSEGLSAQQLDRRLKKGALPAEDLVRFSQQASNESLIGLPSALNTTQASINRLDNSVLILQKNIGDTFQPLEKLRLDALTNLTNLLNQNAQLLKNVGTYLVVWATSPLWKIILNSILSININTSAITFSGAIQGLEKFGLTALRIATPLASLATKFLVFQAVLGTIGQVINRFKDLSGEISGIAEQSKKSTQELEKLFNTQKTSANISTRPKTQAEIESRELQKRSSTGLFGTNLFNFKQVDREILGGIFTGQESYADFLQRIDDVKRNISTIIQSSRNTTNLASSPQLNQELERLDRLDKTIADVQAKKNALLVNDPTNSLAAQGIDKESASLLATRGEYVKNISSLQSAIALRIDELKKAKDVFDELLKSNPDAVTQNEYLSITQNISKELKTQEQLQDRINKSIGKTQTNFEFLQRTIELINSQYADFSQKVESDGNKNKINLTNSLDKNSITPGSFQFLSSVNDVKTNTIKLNESIQNIKRLQSALSSQESKRVLNANGINENTGLNRINLQAQRLADVPNDKYIVEQFGAYKQAKINLESEVLAVSQARSGLINSLKENTKQVGEYYLQITRQVEKSKIDFEIQSNNIAKINAQNSIRKTLIDAEDNIFKQFADSLIQNLEDLADLQNTKTNNKSIILDAQNQLADNAKQSIELSRSLPSDLPSIPVTLDFKDVKSDENVRNLNNELTETNDLSRLINQTFVDTNSIFGKVNSELEKSNTLTNNWQSSLNGVNDTVSNISQGIGGFLTNLNSAINNIPNLVNNAGSTASNLLGNVGNTISNFLKGGTGTPNANGFLSPLRGVSIDQIIKYQPTKGQSFYGLRDGGTRQHSKIDIDSRAGGYEGAIAQAVIDGIAKKRQITGTSGGVDIQGIDAQGRAITAVYNHLRIADLNNLFGNQNQLKISQGQVLGRVTKDALSSGAHLDFGIKINGQYVDPQKFLSTNGSSVNYQTNNVPSNSNNFQTGLVNLVKDFEKFRANAYPDHGQYSVGYGTRAKSPNEVISEKEAVSRLNTELQDALNNVLSNVKPKLKDNQLTALTSLVYNAGSITQFPKLLNAVNSGNFQQASKEFLDINKASGQVLPGLTTRRIKESQLFSGNLALQTSLNGGYLNPGQLQSQVSQGALTNQNVIQQKKILDTQLNNAEIERKKIEIERKNEQALSNFRRGLRDQSDTDLTNRRQIQDLRFNVNPIRTPNENFQNQINQKDREFEDRIRDRQRRLELVINEQIETARKLLANPLIVGNARKELEAGLAQSLQSKTQIENELAELNRLREESKQTADKIFTYQEIFRKQKLFYGTIQDDLNQQAKEIENAQRRNPIDYSRGNQLDVSKDSQLIQISVDYITKRNEIFNSSDLDFVDKRRENIRNILNSFRNSKNTIESFDIQREQQKISDLQTVNDRTSSFESFSNQPTIDLLNARANKINSNGGNQFEANALSRQAAQIQENIRYAKELRDVQIQILQFQFQGIDTTGLESIKDSLQQIHEINIEKIGTDFKTFGSTVENIAKTSLNSLSQGFADLITKGGSLTDIFDNLFNNILNSVINIGLNSLLGGLFGGLFYEGGIVPNYALGGVHGISKSMSKERLMSGRRPMLAVVHAGELQIPADRVDELSRQGLTPDVLLGNFAEGGIIGNPSLNKSYSRNSENRNSENRKITVESTVINKQEYVTIDQFREGIKKAAEMGAEGGEQRVHNKLSNSISYRKSLGL